MIKKIIIANVISYGIMVGISLLMMPKLCEMSVNETKKIIASFED